MAMAQWQNHSTVEQWGIDVPNRKQDPREIRLQRKQTDAVYAEIRRRATNYAPSIDSIGS